MRGLGTLLNGPNTLGGTIEVSHDNAFGRAGTGGMWSSVGVDETAAFVASVGGGRTIENALGGSLSLRGGVAHRQSDGFSLPAGAFDTTATDGLRTNSDLRHSDVFGLLRWENRSGRTLGVTFAGFDAERGVPPEEHVASPRLWRYPYHTRGLVAISGKSGTFATPFGFGSIDIGGGYNSGRQKIESFTDRTYRSSAAEELGNERTLTGRAQLTHTLPRNATLKAAFTLANVDYTEWVPPNAHADYRQMILSGGAEVEVPVGLKTTLAGGLVYDRSSTPESGGRPRAAPFDDAGWRAGLVHELDAHWRVHASASQRSRFPALRELYSGALNRFTPNPDLEPETLLGFETGITVDRAIGPIPDATIQLNAFHHNLDDAVVRVTLQNPTRFFRLNRDRIESMGAELLAGFVFGEDRGRSVSLTGDALVQRVRIYDVTASDAERRPENNPETRGMLELGVPLPLELRGYANARYTGRQYCVHPDTQGQMELSAQTETDLAVERRLVTSRRGLFRSVRLLVSLDNVTDATVFDQCGLPQAGRTLRMMVALR